MNKIHKFLALSAIVLFTSFGALAQDPEGWDDTSSADTPIDGGLSLLIAAGTAYGIKKVRKQRATRD